MITKISDLPELIALDTKSGLIRIPPELDIPLTSRVQSIIDTEEFRRLARITQLGLVSLVYPGARHTRFEHSLGVYRLALLVLKRLVYDTKFTQSVTAHEAELLIAAALLHDIGHYPFCHLVEDMKLTALPSHEEMAEFFIRTGPLAEILRNEWNLDPEDVLRLLNKQPPQKNENEKEQDYLRRKKAFHLLASILSGPIDIDKMDYLLRDSICAGVPYGKNYDLDRLIGSLCLNENGDGLAISDKGKTAAELMVFARYVMFSEVYWHHTVRAATVMFQRAFNDVIPQNRKLSAIETCINFSDESLYLYLKNIAQNDHHKESLRLLEGIFGSRRSLYKRVRQFSVLEEPELYRKLAGRPYSDLREISVLFIKKLNESFDAEKTLSENIQNSRRSVSTANNEDIERNEKLPPKREFQKETDSANRRKIKACAQPPTFFAQDLDLLLDAPPLDKEVEFRIDIYCPREKRYRSLVESSPVIRALAQEQFDDYVKRVRIFARKELALKLKQRNDLNQILTSAIDEFERTRLQYPSVQD